MAPPMASFWTNCCRNNGMAVLLQVEEFQSGMEGWLFSGPPMVVFSTQTSKPNSSDGMRRPVSCGMRYAPSVSTCSRHKEKETGNAEDYHCAQGCKKRFSKGS